MNKVSIISKIFLLWTQIYNIYHHFHNLFMTKTLIMSISCLCLSHSKNHANELRFNHPRIEQPTIAYRTRNLPENLSPMRRSDCELQLNYPHCSAKARATFKSVIDRMLARSGPGDAIHTSCHLMRSFLSLGYSSMLSATKLGRPTTHRHVAFL